MPPCARSKSLLPGQGVGGLARDLKTSSQLFFTDLSIIRVVYFFVKLFRLLIRILSKYSHPTKDLSLEYLLTHSVEYEFALHKS